MPLQNRVTPFGAIVADAAWGTLMGNRGILHDHNKTLGSSRWRHANWVTCVLEFKGRRRPLMAPGHYTELFFLDEPTALAAGHRPCAECRRHDYDRFVNAWMAGHGLSSRPSAKLIDQHLHRDRVARTRRQLTFTAPAQHLPDGTMIEVGGQAWLVWHGRRHRWSFGGYGDAVPLEATDVTVLTPRATVAALAAGYRPMPPAMAGTR